MPDYDNSGGIGVKTIDGQITFGGVASTDTLHYKFARKSTVISCPFPSWETYEQWQEQGINDSNPYLFYQIDEHNYFGATMRLDRDPKAPILTLGPTTRIKIYYVRDDGTVWLPANNYVDIYSQVGYITTTKIGDTSVVERQTLPLERNQCAIGFTMGWSPWCPAPYEANPRQLGFFSMIRGNVTVDGDIPLQKITTSAIYSPSALNSKIICEVNSDDFNGTRFLIGFEDGTVGAPDVQPEKKNPTPSGEGGGGGNYNGSTEPDNFTPLPSLGAVGSGFIHLYNPTQSELSAFGSFLWSKDLFDNISKIFQDPMDLIVTLNVVPCNPTLSGFNEVKLGSLNSHVAMGVISSEFMYVDCGTVFVDMYYDSALDFAPGTKVSCYLPYVGVVSLNADEVMNSYVSIRYNINMLSGGAVAQIKVTKADSNGVDNVLYHYPCNIAYPIEISAKNFSNVYSGIARSLIGGATMGLGVTAGGIGSAIAGTITTGINTMGMKPSITRNGSHTGSSGYLDSKIPSIIIERPIQSYADKFEHFEGLPCNMTRYVRELEGYTEFESIEINTLTCHEDEKKEIEQILKTGFYA